MRVLRIARARARTTEKHATTRASTQADGAKHLLRAVPVSLTRREYDSAANETQRRLKASLQRLESNKEAARVFLVSKQAATPESAADLAKTILESQVQDDEHDECLSLTSVLTRAIAEIRGRNVPRTRHAYEATHALERAAKLLEEASEWCKGLAENKAIAPRNTGYGTRGASKSAEMAKAAHVDKKHNVPSTMEEAQALVATRTIERDRCRALVEYFETHRAWDELIVTVRAMIDADAARRRQSVIASFMSKIRNNCAPGTIPLLALGAGRPGRTRRGPVGFAGSEVIDSLQRCFPTVIVSEWGTTSYCPCGARVTKDIKPGARKRRQARELIRCEVCMRHRGTEEDVDEAVKRVERDGSKLVTVRPRKKPDDAAAAENSQAANPKDDEQENEDGSCSRGDCAPPSRRAPRPDDESRAAA